MQLIQSMRFITTQVAENIYNQQNGPERINATTQKQRSLHQNKLQWDQDIMAVLNVGSECKAPVSKNTVQHETKGHLLHKLILSANSLVCSNSLRT